MVLKEETSRPEGRREEGNRERMIVRGCGTRRIMERIREGRGPSVSGAPLLLGIFLEPEDLPAVFR